MDFIQIAKNAKNASLKIADLSTEIKNKALLKIAEKIESAKDEIFEANKVDLEAARVLVEEGKLSKSTFNPCNHITHFVFVKRKTIKSRF